MEGHFLSGTHLRELYCTVGLGEMCLTCFTLVIKFTVWSQLYLENLMSTEKFPYEVGFTLHDLYSGPGYISNNEVVLRIQEFYPRFMLLNILDFFSFNGYFGSFWKVLL